MKVLETIGRFAERLRKPDLGEVGVVKSSFTLNIMPYNPDDLVRTKGGGLKVYQMMMREPYVKVALNQKKSSLLSVPWDVEPASDDARDAEIAAFVKWNLRTWLKGSFNRDLFEALDALDAGFSVNEKILEICPVGPWKGKVVYRTIKSKDPYWYDFKQDKYGNVDSLILRVDGFKKQEDLDPGKFFVFSYAMRYENPYGNSDLRAAYRAYWIKDTAWKLRAIYMERFSGSNLRGYYPRGDDAAKDKLLEIFRTWQQETAIALPKGLEVDVMNLATSSVSEYERAIADLNKEILVAILGETLTVDEGRKTGARSMGEVHKDIAQLGVLFLEIIITADVNEQIVKPLVDLNFADVVNYPTWRFELREPFEPEKFSRAVKHLKDGGLKVPDAYLYKRFRIPPPSEGEAVSLPIQKVPEPAPAVEKKAEAFAEPPPASGYHRELTPAEKFAELPRVDRRLRNLTDRAIELARPVYERIIERLGSQVEKKGIIKAKDFAGASRLAVNPSGLREVVFKGLITAHMTGRADVVTEAQNQGFEFGKVKKFAEIVFNWEALEGPVTPEEAVKFFSGKVPMTRAAFDALAAQLYDEAFFVSGVEKAHIEKELKGLVTEAVKTGMTGDQFRFRLSEMGVKYATPVYGIEGTQGQKVLSYHAETIFRNNVMSAYNEGKREMYQDPDVKEFFPAYQYSAILDGRETAVCRHLDGKVYLADDPVWKNIWPINHHKCRSTVVSINKYDFTREMLSDKPTVLPHEGFGG